MLNQQGSHTSQPHGTRLVTGFTLIELMVTLVVMGTMLMASLPVIRDWLYNLEIRSAAESIASGLNLARNEAVKRNQIVQFALVSHASGNPGTLDNSCSLSATSASWVVSLDTPGQQCAQAASPVLNPQTAPTPRTLAKHAQGDGSPGVVVEVLAADCTNPSGLTQVWFNGYGRTESDPAPMRCLRITHPGSPSTHPLNVVVHSGGTVRTCDPQVTRTDDPRTCRVSAPL